MSRDALESYFEELDGVSERKAGLAGTHGDLSDRALILESAALGDDFSPKGIATESFQPERSAFPPVPITYDVQTRMWTLLRAYKIQIDGQNLTAPEGFEFDLSSVPRAFWIFIAPNELSIVAPLFHDLIYTYRGELPKKLARPYRTFTRLDTDNLFLKLMETEGVPLWRRIVAYRAVRCFGGTYWDT